MRDFGRSSPLNSCCHCEARSSPPISINKAAIPTQRSHCDPETSGEAACSIHVVTARYKAAIPTQRSHCEVRSSLLIFVATPFIIHFNNSNRFI